MKIILIVDDDADDIDFLQYAIHGIDASIHCIPAYNGEHAMELLTDENNLQPDYIFLDLNMPRLSGKECLRRIKNIPRLAGVPVIIYSTSKIKEDVVESLNLGAVYFLTKPTKLSILKGHICNILEGNWELIRG